MSLSFAQVVPRLLEVAEAEPLLQSATQIAVVRDRKGIIRLAAAVSSASDAACEAAEARLSAALGGWYAGPILLTEGAPSTKRLAREILQQAQGSWPESWPSEVEDPVRGTKRPIDSTRWGAVQRVVSKETWLTKRRASSPWPLHQETPTIVSFYSYKGGVGRSTLVAIVAAMLARAGERVVVIDMDLEAPGQQTLFDATPSRGVIDYVIEHMALGSSELAGLLVDVTDQVPDAKGSVHLAAAGSVDWSYVEKIARLDFMGHTQEVAESPVHLALRELLNQVKGEAKPHWILLDARTGIHDLGGLAVHALAHIDVLPSRAGRQGMDGLRLCLQALVRRRDPADIRALVVHALAPAPLTDSTISVPVQETFRDAVYTLFKDTVYAQIDDAEVPAPDDSEAAHTPYPIPLDPTLGRLETLRSMTGMTGLTHYEHIVTRLRGLAEPEDGSE